MNVTGIIHIKEKLAIGESLSPTERDFVFDCINEAIPAMARVKARAVEAHAAPNYLGRIDALYAALSLDDGGEGLCAAPLGDLTVGLVAADKTRFDSFMRPMARQIAKMFGKPVRIVKFTNRTDIEILQP